MKIKVLLFSALMLCCASSATIATPSRAGIPGEAYGECVDGWFVMYRYIAKKGWVIVSKRIDLDLCPLDRKTL